MLSNAHINDASVGIELVNSSLLIRNCTMDGGGGVSLTGNTSLSLTLDRVSINTPGGYGINAIPFDALDLSLTSSHVSAYRRTVKVISRGPINVRIVNSTVRSTVRREAVDIGGNATQATVLAKSSSFNGVVEIDDFTSDLRHLVCFASDLCT